MARSLSIVVSLSLLGCSLDYDGFDVRSGAGESDGAQGGAADGGAGSGGAGNGGVTGGQGGELGGASTGGASTGGASTGGASSGGSGGMVGGSGGAVGGSGGAPGPVCGDATIDSAEECDDGNATNDDGCSSCVVDCGEPGAFKDPVSLHCYIPLTSGSAWSTHRATCQGLGAGTDLASLSTTAELAGVVGNLGADTWIGGTDAATENTFAWVNGEAWTFAGGQAPWEGSQPNNNGNEDCVVLEVSPPQLWDVDCGASYRGVCERVPLGN